MFQFDLHKRFLKHILQHMNDNADNHEKVLDHTKCWITC